MAASTIVHEPAIQDRRLTTRGGRRHETSPAQIFALSRRCCHAPCRVALCLDASLSLAVGTHHRRLCRRRPGRHPRATDWTVAVGAAWPAIRHREPAGAGAKIATETVVR